MVAVFPTEALMNALGKWRETKEASMLGRLTTCSCNDVHPFSTSLPKPCTCGRTVHLVLRQVTKHDDSLSCSPSSCITRAANKDTWLLCCPSVSSSKQGIMCSSLGDSQPRKICVLGKTSQPSADL